MSNSNIKITQNPDKEYVQEIKRRLKENNGYCPCKLVKTDYTKCMCKEFRDMMDREEAGECHCGLFIIEHVK